MRYVGSAQVVPERLKEHNAGHSRFTSRGIPWIMIHQETFETKADAVKREKILKSGVGGTWLDKIYPQYSHKRRDAGVVFSRRLIRLRRKLAVKKCIMFMFFGVIVLKFVMSVRLKTFWCA